VPAVLVVEFGHFVVDVIVVADHWVVAQIVAVVIAVVAVAVDTVPAVEE